MITKIVDDIVTVEPWGFSPNKYSLEKFTADDLLAERQILAAYRMAHPVSCDLFLALDDQIARAIDEKIRLEGKHCTYPDCGCPEARLCMAGDPNEAAINLNRPPKGKQKRNEESP